MTTYETRNGRPEGQPWEPLADVHALRTAMQLAGLYYSELTALIEDLDAGHILTADNWRQFRRAPGAAL